ncbi:F0F1 ATP synthase subunit B [Defluviimonas sp. 20V17]|uniref:ATP synthase subunit b n=1 Tax=Allgaiera indica TaxID=765699 RepID=A0AAN5A018_9RHOB|nr:F0F1 ATP synthase subunit B [Allgaiera indica]KDB01899.1 F0F1 ATP synthase subunit B [Defluviimonas sp. 20V17]GHE03400.1 ATP synthase subunit b 1 [Allgaiera indica]SDX24673.1 F-type H+-transporting ATPase subunit b [Allgaiera indica]
MKKILIPSLMLLAGPALAAGGSEQSAPSFFSLQNPLLIILIGFLIFCGILIYAGVPGMIARMLDKRADQIKTDLEEARALREEAQTILASYERKQKEVMAQAERIVAQAREEAQAAAEQAKADLQTSIARRIAAAEDQIESAEKAALKEVRDRAIAVAVAAAGDVLAKQMTKESAAEMIDQAIGDVETRLN